MTPASRRLARARRLSLAQLFVVGDVRAHDFDGGGIRPVLVVLITSEPPTTAYRPTYAPTTTAVYEAAKVRDESWQQRTRTFFLATVLWIPVYGWCLVVAVLACVFFTFAWLSAEATVEWLPARKPVTKHPWWVEEDYGGRSGALKWTKTSASRSASQSRLAGSRAEQYSLLHQLG